jgi:hypothetical protein
VAWFLLICKSLAHRISLRHIKAGGKFVSLKKKKRLFFFEQNKIKIIENKLKT